MYRVRPLSQAELLQWDEFVREAENGLLFSTMRYLAHLQRTQVLGVFQGDALVAGFPIPIQETDRKLHIRRTSYLSPYFGPVFGPVRGAPVRADRVRRRVLRALIVYIQTHFDSMQLPLNPQISDMMPFQQAHFQLELRYTYELRLTRLDEIWCQMDRTIRNHIRAAANIQVRPDPELRSFDFRAALSYEDGSAIPDWMTLVKSLICNDRAEVLVAHRDGRPIGATFVACDDRRAYNLLSYYDARAGVRGVPSKLLWSAVERAAERGCQWFDLEGSVLPSIESFFQSFGGARRHYFQVHWYADPALQKPFLYHYGSIHD